MLFSNFPLSILYTIMYIWASLVALMVKNLPTIQKTWVQSLGQEWQPTPVFLLEEFHGELQSMGSQRLRQDWATNPHIHTHTHTHTHSVYMSELLSQLLEKCKSKLQWVITSYQSERPSPENLQTIIAGEDVEKREPSWTVSGNVNWYSHYGKQYGDSLKN